MPDATTSMSREQQAAAEFTNAMSHLAEFGRPEDRLAITALTEVALRFGGCELRMRRSERLQVVGLHTSESKELAASALAENELGLAALPAVRPLIDGLSNEKTDENVLALWREASPRLRKEWREQVGDLDVEAVKARQLIRLADQVCDAADGDGLAGLGRHLADRLEELEKVRRSEDRGTRAESFPYWKIVLAAIFWGIGVGWTIDLLSRGAPWWSPFLVWLFVAVVTFCIALGC